MVHVLEVLLEEGDVDDLAGGEGGVVESGSEGLGFPVGAVAGDLLFGGGEEQGMGVEELGSGGVRTNLRRCHRRPGWYRNSQKMWCQKDRLGNRRM